MSVKTEHDNGEEEIAPRELCCEAFKDIKGDDPMGIWYVTEEIALHYRLVIGAGYNQWQGPGWYLWYDSANTIIRVYFCPFCRTRLSTKDLERKLTQGE